MAKIPPPKRTSKGVPPTVTMAVNNLDKPEGGALKPLNFKVPSEFHREFKAYAATHGISMVELLREGFSLVKGRRGQVMYK